MFLFVFIYLQNNLPEAMASSDPVTTALVTAARSYDLWGTQCQYHSETRFTYKQEHDGRPAFESAGQQYKKYLYFHEERGAWCIGSELGGSIGVTNRDGLAPSPPSSGWEEFCGEEWIASDLVICASPSDVGACVSPPEHALGNNSDLPPLYHGAPFVALMVTMPFTATVFGDAGDPAWTDGKTSCIAHPLGLCDRAPADYSDARPFSQFWLPWTDTCTPRPRPLWHKYLRAIACAAGIPSQPPHNTANVRIRSIADEPSTGSVKVDTVILGGDDHNTEQIGKNLGDGDALQSRINEALISQGLPSAIHFRDPLITFTMHKTLRDIFRPAEMIFLLIEMLFFFASGLQARLWYLVYKKRSDGKCRHCGQLESAHYYADKYCWDIRASAEKWGGSGSSCSNCNKGRDQHIELESVLYCKRAPGNLTQERINEKDEGEWGCRGVCLNVGGCCVEHKQIQTPGRRLAAFVFYWETFLIALKAVGAYSIAFYPSCDTRKCAKVTHNCVMTMLSWFSGLYAIFYGRKRAAEQISKNIPVISKQELVSRARLDLFTSAHITVNLTVSRLVSLWTGVPVGFTNDEFRLYHLRCHHSGSGGSWHTRAGKTSSMSILNGFYSNHFECIMNHGNLSYHE